MVEDSQECVENCHERNLKEFEGKCVSACPAGAPYAQYKDGETGCVAACESDYATADGVCVERCSDPGTYFNRGSGVPKLCRACEAYEITVGMECMAACSSGTAYNESGYSCVSPTGCPFVEEQEFVNAEGVTDSRLVCLDNCGSKVFVKGEYGKMCVRECGADMLTLIKYGYTECVESCPKDQYYSDHSCVESCEVYVNNPANDPALYKCANNCGVKEGVIF